MYDDIEFFEGEKKVISAMIKPKNCSEVVVITDAEYELSTASSEVVESGKCEIDGAEMSLIMKLDTQGKYYLTVTAYVGQEIIKQRAVVRVRG